MQQHLEMLLKKYSVNKNAVIKNCTVVVDGKCMPLLPWRSERRFIEMKKLISGGTVKGISTMRTLHIVEKTNDLYKTMFREFDIAQFVLGSKITEVFAIGDVKNAVNIVAKTEDGYVCTFELAATLPGGSEEIDKHEVIAGNGITCDRAVDTQMPQSSIYVCAAGQSIKYTDVDAELFGLTLEDCAVVRAAFETAKNGIDLSAEVKYLDRLVSCVKESMEKIENISVGECANETD